MKYFIALLLTTLLLTSCSTFKGADFSKISIGMTKEEVVKRLGNKYTIISAKRYEDGILEIYQYLNVGNIYATSDAAYNWLFFFNNKLEEWGPKEDFKRYDYYRDRNIDRR